MKRTEIGKIGEDMACRYLAMKKYLILAKNHKERFDEIDIIARHPGGALIFCEVKTLNSSLLFMPEDNLSPMKLKKMIRAARLFLARHPGMVKEAVGWQIDLVAIVLEEGRLLDLRHYENI